MKPALFDPGLQPERTELAWRRTALATAVGSLIALRLLPATLDDALWIIPGAVGLVISGAIWMGARARYHAYNRALRDGDAAAQPDGRLLLFVTSIVACAGILGLVVVVAS
jgi:uncharacterized membrane protein YidH (DUF202 family)